MVIDGLIRMLQGDTGSADLSAYTDKIAAVTSITGVKVYRSQLPRGFVLPALVVHRSSDSQGYDFNGPDNLDDGGVQIDAYGDDAGQASALYESLKALLLDFKGELPDGTVVSACYLTQGMDVNFLRDLNPKAIADRAIVGFRIVAERA